MPRLLQSNLLLVIFACFLLSHSGIRPVRHVLHFISNVSETRPAAREVSFSPARAPKERCLVRGQRFPANFSQPLHQDATVRYSSMEETKGKLIYRLTSWMAKRSCTCRSLLLSPNYKKKKWIIKLWPDGAVRGRLLTSFGHCAPHEKTSNTLRLLTLTKLKLTRSLAQGFTSWSPTASRCKLL